MRQVSFKSLSKMKACAAKLMKLYTTCFLVGLMLYDSFNADHFPLLNVSTTSKRTIIVEAPM